MGADWRGVGIGGRGFIGRDNHGGDQMIIGTSIGGILKAIHPACYGGLCLTLIGGMLFFVLISSMGQTRIIIVPEGEAPDKAYRQHINKTLAKRLGRKWFFMLAFSVCLLIGAAVACGIGWLAK